MPELLTAGLVLELVADAVDAPSSHNTQPWLFQVHDHHIDLIADRTRALPVNDPFDRELTISCGTALFNLERSARHRGFVPEVEVLPDDDDPDLLARIELVPAPDRPADELHASIAVRRTTRGPFDEAPVEDDIVAELLAAAGEHGAHLQVITGDALAELSELVVEADRAQFADPRWRRELASWMHPRRRGDGLVVPEVVGLATKAVVSAFDVSGSVSGKDRELIDTAPVVAVVSTDEDDPAAWLEAGRTLQHVLLRAASRGVHSGYLNQPCQVDVLRGRLQRLVDDRRYPQVVLRLGRLDDPPRSPPRRPVTEMVIGPGPLDR